MLKKVRNCMNNILKVINADLCTGCGTCTSLCPKKAIIMNLDNQKGIFLPKIDEKLCDDCGICYKVCPGHEVDFNSLNMEIFGKTPEDHFIGNYDNCYVGYSLDEKIRFNASSGGLVTQFLIFILENNIIDGALVTRMSEKDPLNPETFIARTKEEIIEASKSKYCPVSANITLRKIIDAPENEKFAVVGLPCHIHGIRKAEQINKKLNKKIIIHLGLICNHTPSFHATKFMLHNFGIQKKNIKKISYRGEGWPGGMKVTTIDSENIFIPHFSAQYWGAIFNTFFFPYRCTLCTDKSCKLSDITFADAWTSEFMEKDSKGTSLVIIRNNNMKLSDLTNHIMLQNVSDKVLMQSQQLDRVKRRILAQIKLNKFLKKESPKYIEEEINVRISDYLSALLFSIKNLIKSRYLIKLYLLFYEKASIIKSKIS